MLLFPYQCQVKFVHNFNIELCIVVTIMIFSLTVNSLLLFAAFKGSANKSKFYSIIVSIGVADFLASILLAPCYIYLLYRFSRSKNINMISSIVQTILFTVAGSAILSLSFLSIDRLIYLRNPEIYTSSLNHKRQRMILFMVWTVSFAFSLIQHAIDIFLYMLLFSMLIVMVTGVTMTVTLVTYWKHFNNATTMSGSAISEIPSSSNRTKHSTSEITPPFQVSSTNLDVIRNDIRKPSDTPSVATIPGATEDFLEEEFQITTIRPSITAIEIDRNCSSIGKKQRGIVGKSLYESRIVLTLGIITTVFWVFHLPFIIISFHLYNNNSSHRVECNSVLPLHKFIFYFLLISSGARPLVFIIRLSKSRETLARLFNRSRRRQRHYTLEKDCSLN